MSFNILSVSQRNIKDDYMCSICLETKNESKEKKWVKHYGKNGNLHPFHDECLKQHLENTLECPLRCGFDFSKQSRSVQILNFFQKNEVVAIVAVIVGVICGYIFHNYYK